MFEQNAIPKLARSAALRYFSEVAECGSFRAAAESLRIAASAVNRQISNLEADLGVKLFERPRGRAGLRITEAGRILQFRIRSAVNELRIANDEIIALQGLKRGHITFGVNEVLADEIVKRILGPFRLKNPNISYRIIVDNTKSLLDKLQSGEIDFSVGYNFPKQDGIKFHCSIPLKMHIISSNLHKFSSYKYLSFLDLIGEELIIPDNSFYLRKMIEFISQSLKSNFKIVAETNSLSLIRTLVENNIGISIVTGRIEFSKGDPSKICHIEIRDPLFRGSELSCCTLTNRSISAASSAFIDEVVKNITSHSYD